MASLDWKGLTLSYCVRKMSVGCVTATVPQPTDLYTHNIPNAVCLAPPEDEQVMFEICRGP
jgi:hypothetical protein